MERDAAGEIRVQVVDGVITLEGHVQSQSHKRFAGVLALWTPGRRDVVNSLAIRPEYEGGDDEVTEVLELVFEADPMVDPSNRAELDAWALFGVERVVNRLQVTD